MEILATSFKHAFVVMQMSGLNWDTESHLIRSSFRWKALVFCDKFNIGYVLWVKIVYLKWKYCKLGIRVCL